MFTGGGTVVARHDYDPYGRSTTVLGTTPTDFNFTGLYRHSKSNLDLATYRAYDPDLGRWLNRDPIAEKGGVNLYAYVENDSLNSTDLLGLETEIVIHRNAPSPGQQARDASGIMSVFHDGEFQFSTPVNRYGYQDGTHGIYPGDYTVAPRTNADSTSRFPNGTPGVIAPGEITPGDAGRGFHDVYIHYEANLREGGSRGCPTVPPSAADRIRALMQIDQKKGESTTLRVFNYSGVPFAIPRR
ncbi:MAG TPA: RHS repeat-associated core domain-containing protein [Chthoniobacterales bacterium]|nr:RHS repeat-associated core domain-containing protein [Chthoniobacterales bacterium]